MKMAEKVLLKQLIEETVYTLNEHNLDEGIKSHLATAGLGAAAMFGAMTGQNADTAKRVNVNSHPQAVHQSYQAPSQQSQSYNQQSQSSFVDSIGYKVPSRFQHVKAGLEEVQYWVNPGDARHKQQAKTLLKKWEKHIDRALKQLGKSPSDLFVDRKGLVRLKFRKKPTGMSIGPGENTTDNGNYKPLRRAQIKYLKTLD